MLPKDPASNRKLGDVGLCLLLGLFSSWCWIVFQSPTSLSIALGSTVVPARLVLLASFAAVGVGLFVVRRRRPLAKPAVRKRRRIAVTAGLAAAIVLTDVADGFFDGEVAGFAFAIQMVAFGAASAYLYAEIGTVLGLAGKSRPRLVALSCAFALIICVPFQVALYYSQGYLRESCMVAILVGTPFVLEWLRGSFKLREARQPAPVPVPVKFALTLLLAGLSLGILQAEFAKILALEGHSPLNPLSSVGFLLASAFSAFLMLKGKLDYNRILYQAALPVMALGFALLAMGGDTFVAFTLCIAGYCTTQAVLWVLGAYLTSGAKGMARWLFAIMGAIMALGQFLGLLAVDTVLQQHVREAAVIVCVALLLACLFMVTSESPYESWGMVSPTDRPTELSIDDACSILAIDAQMTAREREILPLLVQGRSRKVIAEKLILSENTIKTYVSNVYAKTGVHTQQELIDLVRNRAREAKNDE